MLKAYEKLVRLAIKDKDLSEDGLKKLKRNIAKEFKIDMPRTEEIRKCYAAMVKKGKLRRNRQLEQRLVLKRTRTLSGVAVVAVLTKSYPCKSNCLYCPGEKEMPKSYLSNEPAVMRAIRLGFDPYWQTRRRVEILEYNGHDVSKLELIVMGGTFSHLPSKYRYWFVLNCFLAANGQQPAPESLGWAEIRRRLAMAKKKNVKARHRIVGLTLETRPDEIDLKELKEFRELGCTRVEIGVQSLDDQVLLKNRRGHGRKETIQATKLLKEMGFKINYHMMPGLLGSSFEKDRQMFRELFSSPDFQPDMLKIYPCVVTREAELYQWWKKGKYQPYTNEELARLLKAIKRRIPPYVRITRLVRDIPTSSIEAGPDIPNLRGLFKEQGVQCACIRCREIGRARETDAAAAREPDKMLRSRLRNKLRSNKVRLERINYAASGGQEIFLQMVSGQEQWLHAFLRLRIPAFIQENKKAPVPELAGAAIIREVHSYGQVAPVGKRVAGSSQHRGWGRKLVKKALEIAWQEFELKRVAVIAAEGTKDYYQQLGFKEKGRYMVWGQESSDDR